MRALPLLRKHFPLPHTKTVLFIRHDQCQICIGHLFLNQGMSPYYNIHFLGSYTRTDLSFAGRCHRTHQKRGSDTNRLQIFHKFLVMLLCQNFRWHHDCSLMPIFCCADKCQKCNHRLTRTNIPLNQPVHHKSRLQIPPNIFPCILLACRKAKRQRFKKLFYTAARFYLINGRHLILLFLHLTKRERKKKKFLKYKTASCLCICLPALWKMNRLNCLFMKQKIISFSNLQRQEIRLKFVLRQRKGYCLFYCIICKSCRKRIDWLKLSKLVSILFFRQNFRLRHLQKTIFSYNLSS